MYNNIFKLLFTKEQTNLLLNSIVNGINGWRKERISKNMRASVGRGEKKETKSERGRERERA